jgi:peptide-methionine (S)-S-oxide reductase
MSETAKPEIATLAGGCFWCLEAAFSELNGVSAVQSGYTGGQVKNPSYSQVCTGTTGHAEAVQISFDPAVITYADLLRVFFTIHDPTTLNRQGGDVGTQYRSAIYTGDAAQAATAHAVRDEFAKIWPAKIVTEIAPLGEYFPAEPEHDNYFARNPYAGYCQAVVAPKVVKVRKAFADKLRSRAA